MEYAWNKHEILFFFEFKPMHVVKDILFAHVSYVFPIRNDYCSTFANHGGKKLLMIHVRATAVLFKKQHHHETHDD